MLHLAFQGVHGAYSEAAALQLLGPQIEPVPCPTFEEVFARVQSGQVERGLVPIENSLAGSIHRNYDLLLEHELSIVGETNLRVEHQLLALPGVELKDVRRVLSHPQALAQCEHYLRTLEGVEMVPAYDTAGSARMLKEEGWRDAAAVASARAAETYGLQILVPSIEDDPENYTRFLLLSRQPAPPDAATDWKTSIAFAMENRPGVLFKTLAVFALREIDLTKIESRPFRGRPWEYIFYLDFAGPAHEEPGSRALDHLREITAFLRVFGSYPRAR